MGLTGKSKIIIGYLDEWWDHTNLQKCPSSWTVWLVRGDSHLERTEVNAEDQIRDLVSWHGRVLSTHADIHPRTCVWAWECREQGCTHGALLNFSADQLEERIRTGQSVSMCIYVLQVFKWVVVNHLSLCSISNSPVFLQQFSQVTNACYEGEEYPSSAKLWIYSFCWIFAHNRDWLKWEEDMAMLTLPRISSLLKINASNLVTNRGQNQTSLPWEGATCSHTRLSRQD